MNERIEKLLVESFFEGDDSPSDKIYKINEAMIQKFAELIVQECMNVALVQKEWVDNQAVFDPRDQAWNKARIQQSQHIVDKIKEHFGDAE